MKVARLNRRSACSEGSRPEQQCHQVGCQSTPDSLLLGCCFSGPCSAAPSALQLLWFLHLFEGCLRWAGQAAT